MTKKDTKIAKELKKRLLKVTQLVDFRIFGSRARGDADKYSDMDVFIEVEYLNKQLKGKIWHVAWKVGFDNLIHISPLIFTRDEIENSPMRSSPIVKNVNEEGIRI